MNIQPDNDKLFDVPGFRVRPVMDAIVLGIVLIVLPSFVMMIGSGQ